MRFLVLGLLLALLLESIFALLPSGLVAHDHLLVGNVTAEQLRAHLAAEAQEVQDLGRSVTVPGSPPNQVSMTSTGGRIISEFPGFGFILTLQFEMALQVVSLLLIPIFCFSIRSMHLYMQALLLSPPNPPPRSARISRYN